MLGRLGEDQIEDVLQTATIGRIGCRDGNSVYIVPISYVYDDSCIYGHSAEGRQLTRRDLYDAIMEGAVERVRPKMMTVVAIMAGLLPIMWSTGTGSEIMQRIAVPMIGGMVSSTLLTLIVIPAIYALVKGAGLEKSQLPDRREWKSSAAVNR